MPHADLALQPSSFKRTMMCPGWANLCRGLPKGAPSDFANEGTLAHDIGSCCLARKQDPYAYVKRTGYVNAKGGVCYDEDPGNAVYSKVIDDEMAGFVSDYVQAAKDIEASMVNPMVKIEEKLDLSWLVPGMYGTGDFVAVETLGRIHVLDLKYGRGVLVEVEDNPQLKIYALGALRENNPDMVEEVVVTIHQPRAPHPDGPVRTITYGVTELYEWGSHVLKPAAEASQQPAAALNPGEWCLFCPANYGAGFCPAKAKDMFGDADIVLGEDLVPVDENPVVEPETWTSEKLDRMLKFCDAWDTCAKTIRTEAHRRLEAGEKDAPAAYKLVQGKLSNRAWAEPDDIPVKFQKVLDRNDIYKEIQVEGPAGIERALKKKGLKPAEIAELVNPLLKERTAGKASMVPVEDKRPALPPSVERMFGKK